VTNIAIASNPRSTQLCSGATERESISRILALTFQMPNLEVRRRAGLSGWRTSTRDLVVLIVLLVTGATSAPLFAQTRLTVDEALARASSANPAVRASAVAEQEAQARLRQARAGLLPTADLTETWQRGNQPVFVFSSLLAQRQFAAPNFAIDALNHPSALTNYRSAVTVDAPIFDPATRAAVHSAALGVDVAGVQRETVQRDLAVSVVAAYGAVVNAVATGRVVAASLETVQADLTLAEQRRDQGVATEADVLQMRLHLAATRERQIRVTADEAVARARLNQLLGAGLDERFVVDEPIDAAASTPSPMAALETAAVSVRTEVRLADLNQALADSTLQATRATFYPKVSAMAAWEGNGGQWNDRASGWMVGAVARVNLFRGFADRARLAEARELQQRRRIEREQVETAVRVDVREAQARLDAARAMADVAEAAVAQAAESHRIVRDRYEGGLADITALLRAAEGIQAAETRRVTAHVEVLLAVAVWRRATGK
jgi:outer membrane protein